MKSLAVVAAAGVLILCASAAAEPRIGRAAIMKMVGIYRGHIKPLRVRSIGGAGCGTTPYDYINIEAWPLAADLKAVWFNNFGYYEGIARVIRRGFKVEYIWTDSLGYRRQDLLKVTRITRSAARVMHRELVMLNAASTRGCVFKYGGRVTHAFAD